MDAYRLMADYHTHTHYSHGKGTIESNVLQAIERGFRAIAITDHGFSQPMVGLTGEKFMHMRKIVDELNHRFAGQIDVLLGVEANVISMDGRIDVPKRCLPLVDILNLGLHAAVATTSLSYIKHIVFRRKHHPSHALAKDCTDALIRAIERYPVDILTHPGFRYPVLMDELAAVAASTDTAIEINAAHQRPTVADIQTALDAGARFAIGSDAHRPEHVGRFDNGIALAQQANVPPQSIINDERSGFVLKRRR